METSRSFFDYIAIGLTVALILAMLALIARTLMLVVGFLSLSYASWREWFTKRTPAKPTDGVPEKGTTD